MTLTAGREPGTWDVRVRDPRGDQRGYQLRIEPPPREARSRDDRRDDRRSKPPRSGPGATPPSRQAQGSAQEQARPQGPGQGPARPPAPPRAAAPARPAIRRFSITPMTTILKGLAMTNRSGSRSRAVRAARARSTAGLALAALPPGALAAQETSAVYEQPQNMLLWWAGLFALLAALWFILYKIVYPFFLRYYRDDFCKTVFWNLFILYGATLVLLFSYFPLGIGFYYDWTKWLAAFLCALWMISLLVLMLRRRPA